MCIYHVNNDFNFFFIYFFYVACTVIFVISFSYVCRSKSPTGLMFDVNHIRR